MASFLASICNRFGVLLGCLGASVEDPVWACFGRSGRLGPSWTVFRPFRAPGQGLELPRGECLASCVFLGYFLASFWGLLDAILGSSWSLLEAV